MSWSLSRVLLGISDFKKSHYRWVEWFWHFKVQQVLMFFLKQKVHTGDVGWVTLQVNLYLHWTRRYFLFTPRWTHQEPRKKLHLGEGSIEQTQCALSSEKPWRVNQLRPQCPVSFAVWCILVKIHYSFLQIKWKKTGKAIKYSDVAPEWVHPWCLGLVYFLLIMLLRKSV